MIRPSTRLDRGGFTLIELLVALVIGSIVVGSVFQLITGQGRFVDLQSGREEVQQNSRAAVELIGSTLRTVPGGGALVAAADDSITIRSARSWGVVCAATGATSLDLALPAVPGANYSVNLGTGIVVNLASPDTLWSNAVAVTSVGNAATNCGGSALPAGVERRSVALSATPQNGATTPAVGNVVYLYDQITYRSGEPEGVPGLWIQRRLGQGGSATNQPMAGPISDTGGLRFQYFAGASTTPLLTPITSASDRESVTRVVVVVEAVSRISLGDYRGSKADTVVVALRNRM